MISASLALAGAAMAKNIVVQVSDSKAGLNYNPNNIVADVGDTVQYIFNPKVHLLSSFPPLTFPSSPPNPLTRPAHQNHTVAESSFAQPCVPLAASTPGSTGFFSGFQPFNGTASLQPSFTLHVADTQPHWFYCAQAKHCEMGMVGVINAPAAKPQNNISAFAAPARAVNATVVPSAIGGGDLASVPFVGGANNASSSSSAAGAALPSSIPATGIAYTTAWTYTSAGSVVAATTTEQVASFVASASATSWTVTSAGAVFTDAATQTVQVAVPVSAHNGAAGFADGAGSGALAAVGGLAGVLGFLMM